MKIITSLVLLCVLSNGHTQVLEYPELNVTPRASDRIKLEAKYESKKNWSDLLPVQLSALSTLVAGGMASSSIKDEKEDEGGDKAPMFAMGVGAAWLGASIWVTKKYRPYRAAYIKHKNFKRNTLREKLTLERLAEEEINDLKSMGMKMRYLSVLTNLAASGVLLENVEDETDAKITAGLSALMSFAPLFFKTRWEKVGNEQEKYKRKIFSPVALAPVLFDPFTTKKASGVSLLYRF